MSSAECSLEKTAMVVLLPSDIRSIYPETTSDWPRSLNRTLNLED